MQQFMGNIAKIQKGIKRKAPSPVVPQTPASLKQSPQTPSTSKKPKFSFKTGSKGKRLLPKTPKKSKTKPTSPSTSFSTADEDFEQPLPFSEQVGESPWKSPTQLAAESLKAIRRKIRKSQSEERKKEGLLKTAQKRALKRLAPAPGWKPFGTPTKRKLHGKDW